MAVGFGEYKRLGYFLASGKYVGQLVAEGPDDSPNLIRIDDGTIELRGRIDFVLILTLPPLLASKTLALFACCSALIFAPFFVTSVSMR
jgi:hypothetical protein